MNVLIKCGYCYYGKLDGRACLCRFLRASLNLLRLRQRTFASTIMKKLLVHLPVWVLRAWYCFSHTLHKKKIAFRLEVKVQGEFDLANVMIKCMFKSRWAWCLKPFIISSRFILTRTYTEKISLEQQLWESRLSTKSFSSVESLKNHGVIMGAGHISPQKSERKKLCVYIHIYVYIHCPLY